MGAGPAGGGHSPPLQEKACSVAAFVRARPEHTGDFIIFNYGPKESAELLPQPGLGSTRPAAQRVLR